jgi:hypothetical protein
MQREELFWEEDDEFSLKNGTSGFWECNKLEMPDKQLKLQCGAYWEEVGGGLTHTYSLCPLTYLHLLT